MDFFGYVASLFMGIVLGVMGGGGSILTVPILVYFFNLPPSIATGYSLFVVGVTALIGFFIYYRKGQVDFRVGLYFALPSIIGVSLSRIFVVPSLPPIVLHLGGLLITKEIFVMFVFASLMIVASYSMISRRKTRVETEIKSSFRATLLAAQGLVIGGIAGFVGAGGGFLIIPALVLLAGLPMRMAVGTSLLIIASQSLLGFAGDVLRGAFVDWRLLLIVATIAALGIGLGSSFSHKIEEQKLKVAFGWFVLILGSSILIEQIRQT